MIILGLAQLRKSISFEFFVLCWLSWVETRYCLSCAAFDGHSVGQFVNAFGDDEFCNISQNCSFATKLTLMIECHKQT